MVIYIDLVIMHLVRKNCYCYDCRDQDRIDELDDSTGEQLGHVIVTCTEGRFTPDIFTGSVLDSYSLIMCRL